jgi:hypothetical protein
VTTAPRADFPNLMLILFPILDVTVGGLGDVKPQLARV